MERIAAGYDKTFCLAEVNIFADLSPTEMDAIAAAALTSMAWPAEAGD